MATDNRGGLPAPIVTSGTAPVIRWEFDERAPSFTMNNGGGGAREVVSSNVVDISGSGKLFFTGALQIDDTSSGNEADDSFVAYLVLDGDTANPVNLITPHDTQSPDGVLSDNELAPSPGTYVREFNHEVPSSADSLQIIIEGINNSNSETFTVRDLLLSEPETGGGILFFDVEKGDDELILSWSSSAGELYNLRSEIDPSAADPAAWPIFGGHTGMVATPPLNTLTIPLPADPERYFVIEAIPAPPSDLLSDDFESGEGEWTTGSEGDAGTLWELGSPEVGPFGAHSGDNCFGTNLADDYDFNADVWLRTPPLDLSTASRATLRYYQFYDIEPPNAQPPFEVFDFGTVTVLDAADDSELAVLEPALTDFSLDWEEVSFPLPAAAFGKTIRIEFRLSADDVSNYPGWYIDDVQVTIP